MLFLRSLFFTILIPGTVLVVIPYYLTRETSTGFGLVQVASLVPIAIGAAIMAWCIRDFAVQGRGTLAPVDPPRHLVDRGLYRYVRNPMYLGGVLILLGESAFYQSRAVLLFGAAWFVAVNLFVVFYEEPTLRRLFGESYAQYCRTVPRWIPRMHP